MECNNSWETNGSPVGGNILRLLWNSNVHYGTHKRSLLDPMVNRMNQVRILTVYSFQMHFNIILLHTPMSPQWFLTVNLPTAVLYVSCTLVLHVSHISPFSSDHAKWNLSRVNYEVPRCVIFSTLLFLSLCLRPRYSPQHFNLRHTQFVIWCSSFRFRRLSFTTIQNKG
jgi:hypothetical protein